MQIKKGLKLEQSKTLDYLVGVAGLIRKAQKFVAFSPRYEPGSHSATNKKTPSFDEVY